MSGNDEQAGAVFGDMSYDPLLTPVFGVTIWGCTTCGCLIAAGPSFQRHRHWHEVRGENASEETK